MKVGCCSDILAVCAYGGPVQASDPAANKYTAVYSRPAFPVASPERDTGGALVEP